MHVVAFVMMGGAVMAAAGSAEPEPAWQAPVTPREVLFDGRGLESWRDAPLSGQRGWVVRDGVLLCEARDAVQTAATFEAFLLRVEYALPAVESELAGGTKSGRDILRMPCGMEVELRGPQHAKGSIGAVVDGISSGLSRA